jgi:hypothetical protein
MYYQIAGGLTLKETYHERPRETYEYKDDRGSLAWVNEKSNPCSNYTILRHKSCVDSDSHRAISDIWDNNTSSNDGTNVIGSISILPSTNDADDLQTDSVITPSPTSNLQTRLDGCYLGTTKSVSPNEYQNTLYTMQNSAHGCEKVTRSDTTNISRNICRCWQWKNSYGLWLDYPDHVNNLINSRLQQHPQATVVIHYNDQR